MDSTTAKALEDSIRHWEDIIAAETFDATDTSADACALCDQFVRFNCNGCPVKERTGDTYCRKSPYARVHRAKETNDWPAFKEAAMEELQFLKSLREPVPALPAPLGDLLDENIGLKEQIKEYKEQAEFLRTENDALHSDIKRIKKSSSREMEELRTGRNEALAQLEEMRQDLLDFSQRLRQSESKLSIVRSFVCDEEGK